MTRRQRENLRNGLLFVSPWLLGILIFLLYPIAASFYYSFCEYSVLTPTQYIGLGNYQDLMNDEVFWKSLWNTFIYAVVALPLTSIIAILLALLLNMDIKGKSFFRTIYFLPSLLPVIAVAILWQWIFNGQFGLLNYLLSFGGIAGPNWLTDPKWSKTALIIMSLWGAGNTMIIYLAGLQEVPQELYEAAELDGAVGLRKVWHVTLPMISPVIYFNVIMGIIGTLQVFAAPYILGGGAGSIGAPARSLLFYTMYLYDNAFRYLRMGYASAMAWILFILILVCTWLATWISKRYIYYAGK
jgi:multiple sugar transport system permease protein